MGTNGGCKCIPDQLRPAERARLREIFTKLREYIEGEPRRMRALVAPLPVGPVDPVDGLPPPEVIVRIAAKRLTDLNTVEALRAAHPQKPRS